MESGSGQIFFFITKPIILYGIISKSEVYYIAILV